MLLTSLSAIKSTFSMIPLLLPNLPKTTKRLSATNKPNRWHRLSALMAASTHRRKRKKELKRWFTKRLKQRSLILIICGLKRTKIVYFNKIYFYLIFSPYIQIVHVLRSFIELIAFWNEFDCDFFPV